MGEGKREKGWKRGERRKKEQLNKQTKKDRILDKIVTLASP